MADEKPLTAFGFNLTPQTSASDPHTQSEELLYRVLIPITDIIRGHGHREQAGNHWHPGAIYLALFRAGVKAMGVEWILQDKDTMLQAWEALQPLLVEEMVESFEAGQKAYAAMQTAKQDAAMASVDSATATKQ